MAKTKDSIRIVSYADGGKEIVIEAPARPISLRLLAEVEDLRRKYTDFEELASLVASMAEAGYDENDEDMKQFRPLIALFEKGFTQAQAVEFLKSNMPQIVMENLRVEMRLLQKVIDRSNLTSFEKECIESDLDADFWQNADLACVRGQAMEFFRAYI
jgi:hypothetical protein